MKRTFLLFLLIIFSARAFATHHRAGEIRYEYLYGYTYKITIITYDKTGPMIADACHLTIHFSSNPGDSAVVSRSNGPAATCAPEHDGVPISGTSSKYCEYEVVHTYPGPGTYTLTVSDNARNSGICNINGGMSVNETFTLFADLVINPFLPPNSSVQLLKMPLDLACVGQCFEHNPEAFDPDNDSLYYFLTSCYTDAGPIPTWNYPPGMSSSSIDHRTGTITWCSPNTICEYNIAIVVEEWKLLPGSHHRYYAGRVLRDMQIDVTSCSNISPQITSAPDTCIIAGTTLSLNVSATDSGPGTLSLTANGGPFHSTPAATFSSTSGIGSASGTFSWTPDCSEIQLTPYPVYFEVNDNDPVVPLVNFESMQIHVIAPPPTDLTATPSGSTIILNWSPPPCSASSNPLISYYVYRKDACDTWTPSPCETGVPAYTGYVLIGTTTSALTAFTDDNGGAGLVHGQDYSYMIVAVYSDGSQSIASSQVCMKLVRDVPIITNVSVISTGSSDSIWIHWLKPLADAVNLDTIADPAPYEFRLMRAQGNSGALSYTTAASYIYSSYAAMSDTGFISTTLNTQNFPFTYRVDFYSNGTLVGSTHTASSIYVSAVPGDNTVSLSWQEFVPWDNDLFYVFRKQSGSFSLLDSTSQHTYTDSSLVNGISYCYFIRSRGAYSDTSLIHPLYNNSEIVCAEPVDLVPPCQPSFSVIADCRAATDLISWTNPNTYCSNDAIQYNIYWSPTPDDPMTIIYSSPDMNVTSFNYQANYEGMHTVAGCFAVTAVDSFANESPVVNKFCTDNCPEYELPNIFTPNGDGHNDLFKPLPYRFVKDVDIEIYDRWGLLMFRTSDPNVNWNGTNSSTGGACPDGTYFYVCTVDEIRISGIVPRVLRGFVQLQRSSGKAAY